MPQTEFIELPMTNVSAQLKIGKQNISVNEFTSWTGFSDENLKYFSGIGTYTINFDVEGIGETDSLMLAITNFKSTANIKLNNVDLGDIWIPGHKINVTGILKEKRNVMVVKVANVYRNRIIGDLNKSGDTKSCFTTARQLTQLTKDMPLQDSGILGPVKIYRF